MAIRQAGHLPEMMVHINHQIKHWNTLTRIPADTELTYSGAARRKSRKGCRWPEGVKLT